MSLLVVRHGQTNYNVDDLVCGVSPAKLTTLGIEQAKQTGLILKDEKIDYLYVSPLDRAIDTASYINEYHHLDMNIENALKEINFGKHEGVHRTNKDFQAVKINLAMHYPGGESFVEVCSRVYQFLDSIKEQATNHNVLLVCHGGICRAINTYFHEMSNDDIYHYQVENCCVLKYEYK